MNLLEDTLRTLQAHGRSSSLVHWVGSRDGVYSMSWVEFAWLADQIDYSPYGGGEVLAADLVIVGFGGWWMDRGVVNGRAGWRYQQLPKRLGRGRPFIRLMGSRNAATTTMAGLNRLFHEVDPLASPDEDEPNHPGYALHPDEA